LQARQFQVVLEFGAGIGFFGTFGQDLKECTRLEDSVFIVAGLAGDDHI
jgi:hypothetical protein